MSLIPVWLRTLYYRAKYQWILRRVSFGPGVEVHCRLEIKGPGAVTLGPNSTIKSDPWGDDFVTLFTHSPNARLQIGGRVHLRGTRIGCRDSILIEDGATVDCASIFDNDFHELDATRRDNQQSLVSRPVRIGRCSYVGPEVICGKGTELQERTCVLAGSVVSTKRVASGAILFGNPARVIDRTSNQPPEGGTSCEL